MKSILLKKEKLDDSASLQPPPPQNQCLTWIFSDVLDNSADAKQN